MAKIGGRQVEVGIGIEATAGTAVAATDYFKWDSFSFQSNVDKVMLTSARGIRNENSNSVIYRRYGKGDLECVPTVDIFPYILSLAMGTRNTTTDSDGSGTVYDHTYTVQNANASMKTATILVKQGGVQTEQYTNCVVDSMSITVDKDLAKCKLTLLGAYPGTGSVTPSYTQDTMFTKSNMTAQFGSSLSAALGTAATTTLTSNTTAPANNSLITIGTVVYKYVTSLSGAAYEVLIGISAATALTNLQSAINGTSGAGTTYGTGTVAHPLVVATAVTTTTLTLVSILTGTQSNSIVTTAGSSPATNDTWSGTTMNSGTPGTGSIPLALINFSFDMNNGVLMDDAFLSGSTDPIAGGYVAGPLKIKGSYTLQFADTVGLAKYQANTIDACVVTLTGARIGTSANEQIIFKLGRLVLNKAPLEYQIKGLTYLKQEFEVQYDATDKELTCIVKNLNSGSNY